MSKVVKYVPSDVPNDAAKVLGFLEQYASNGVGWELPLFFDDADAAKADYANYKIGPDDKPTVYRITVEAVEEGE